MFKTGNEVESTTTSVAGKITGLRRSENLARVKFTTGGEHWVHSSELRLTKGAPSTPTQENADRQATTPPAPGLKSFESLEEAKEFAKRDSTFKIFFQETSRSWVAAPRSSRQPALTPTTTQKHSKSGQGSVQSGPRAMSPKHETVAQLERRRLELKSLLASTSGAGKNLGHYNKKVDTSNAVEALNWKTELDSIEETLSRHGAMEFWQNSNSTYD